MEELFADLCQVPRFAGQRRGFRPPVDVYRTDDPPAINVVVELAVEDNVLVVAGVRVREGGSARVYHQMYIDYGPFQRRVQITEPVDAERAEAAYSRGFLRVVFPISRRPSAPVRVPVTRRQNP